MRSLIVIFGFLLVSCLAYDDYTVIQERSFFPKGWKAIAEVRYDQPISFSLVMYQCNLDILDKIFWEVSDPTSPKYGEYLTSVEIDELVSCPGYNGRVVKWLALYDINQYKIISNSIRVTAPAYKVARLLQTKFAYVHNEKKQLTEVRHVGTVGIPTELRDVIQMITGISEFFHDAKYTAEPVLSVEEKVKKVSSRLGSGPTIETISDPLVTPNTIRTRYNITVASSTNSKNSLGIAAFTDVYNENALCAFHQLFSFQSQNINWEGSFQEADEVESDLDIQYSTAIANGIQNVVFSNHASGVWILDWAQEAVNDADGPFVWSISYGWPEVWECNGPVANITDCPATWDNTQYIQTTNVEIQKLGVKGVTVFVASGDDGTPGFASNCPMNPNVGCPFPDNSCECGGFFISLTQSGTTYLCSYPVGTAFDQPGCGAVMDSAACATAIQQFTTQKAVNSNGEPCSFDQNFANCSCTDFPQAKSTSGGDVCVVSGQWDISYGLPFFADFPGASPYVTSVGATANQWDLAACQDTTTLPEIYAYTLDMSGFGGGGGFSSISAMPSYQQKSVKQYLSTATGLPPSFTFNSTNRAYPDIAANGHNNIIVYGFNSITPVGGTSASSPTMAGMFALVNDWLLTNNKPTLGFLNPLLYQLAQSNPNVFNDITPHQVEINGTLITEGPNTACTEQYCCEWGFPIASGWDAGTGLGSVNFGNFLKALKDMWKQRDSKF